MAQPSTGWKRLPYSKRRVGLAWLSLVARYDLGSVIATLLCTTLLLRLTNQDLSVHAIWGQKGRQNQGAHQARRPPTTRRFSLTGAFDFSLLQRQRVDASEPAPETRVSGTCS